MPTLSKGIPVFASLDIDKTVTFYRDRLGFDKLGWKEENYAIVARAQVVIHFWKCNDRIHPENTSCYIDVEGIDSLYDEMSAQGVVHPNGPLRDQPWGMREFAILDQDGNMIKFRQPLAV